MLVVRSTEGRVAGMSSAPVFLRVPELASGVQIRLGVSGYQSGGSAGVPIALGVRTSAGGTVIGLSGVALIETTPSAVGTGIPPGVTFTTPAGGS